MNIPGCYEKGCSRPPENRRDAGFLTPLTLQGKEKRQNPFMV